jgi:hypothetical protein
MAFKADWTTIPDLACTLSQLSAGPGSTQNEVNFTPKKQ